MSFQKISNLLFFRTQLKLKSLRVMYSVYQKGYKEENSDGTTIQDKTDK